MGVINCLITRLEGAAPHGKRQTRSRDSEILFAVLYAIEAFGHGSPAVGNVARSRSLTSLR